MKTTFIVYLFFISFFTLLVCCTPKKDKVPESATKEVSEAGVGGGILDTLSKAKFDEWTRRWGNKGSKYLDTSKITYFTMPLLDLSEFLGENPSTSRYYIGLDSMSSNAYMPHIMLVGTNANGSPRFNSPFHIFDVTTVCPPVCGMQ